jgi:hypothetical protein
LLQEALELEVQQYIERFQQLKSVIFPRKSGHAQAASLVECSSNAAGVA